VTGQFHSSRVYSIRGHGNPSIFLLYSLRKQFQNVAQYDEHSNSYAHHHKIRFKEMQSSERTETNSQEAIEKPREKERKREELRKAAGAAGVKLNTITPVVGMINATKNSAVTTATAGTEPAGG